MNNLFPVFLKLEHLHSLIVGGGYVAHEKLTAILANSPQSRITLVAPEIRESIREIALENPRLTLENRDFAPEDLEEKDLIFVATNVPELNRAIKALASERHLLVNVADTPDQCDFYLSSVVQKGNLKLGISTNGLSPTLAKRLREVLSDAIPDNLETAMHQLNELRNYLKGDFARKVDELNALTESLVRKRGKG
ncbi:NAD(P)-dependent oxidoreductase [Ravibacter arvi]|uniref:precorrin-2 dehydrogenase n=1 Tax=Ravibacter arvi TaxID=2051041 RepID=A0ABP8M2D3_9BACT